MNVMSGDIAVILWPGVEKHKDEHLTLGTSEQKGKCAKHLNLHSKYLLPNFLL